MVVPIHDEIKCDERGLLPYFISLVTCCDCQLCFDACTILVCTGVIISNKCEIVNCTMHGCIGPLLVIHIFSRQFFSLNLKTELVFRIATTTKTASSTTMADLF